MPQDNITQIRVGNSPVGIIGLKNVMADMSEEYAERPDDEVGDELVERLSKKNYIPDRVKPDYAKSFLREFQKFLGKPYEEEVSEGVEAKVLGPGCVQCDGLEMTRMQVMAEINLVADIQHVRDIKEIGKYGVMGSPALLINGKVKSVGKVLPKKKLKERLTEAQG
jgi:hypothetical protein